MSTAEKPRRSLGRRAIGVLPKVLAPVILLVIGSVSTSAIPKLLAGRSIKLDPPVGLKLDQGTFLEEYVDQPPSVTHVIGVEFQSNVTITGYDGRQLKVICTVSDPRTGNSATRPHNITAGSNRTTQPCFLPLPGPARDPFTVQVAIADPAGAGTISEAFATIP